jgi:hypothetical protein
LHDYLTSKDIFIQSPSYRALLRAVKQRLEKKLRDEFNIKVNVDDLPSYFCFILDKTGHAVHKLRPEEISKMIPIYLTTLQAIREQK